jgi:hypothetical protein
MPNYCSNSVTLSGPKELIEKLAKAFNEGKFLGTLRPEPDYDDNDDGWYSWRVSNWGTKWEINEDDPDVEVTESKGVYSFYVFFQSAWAPPTEAYAYAVQNFEGLTIDGLLLRGWLRFHGVLG